MQLTVQNAIITLGDTDDLTKGRHFKSRFIQPGLAGYPEQFGTVLIGKEALDNFVYSLENKPVIIRHKSEIKDSDIVGTVKNVWYNEEDGWYWCDGIITDADAIDLVKNQKWSVSCSYDVLKADNEGGTENNIPYDMEFLDGVFTHLALVDNPRYERANIVFNSKTIITNYKENQPRDKYGRWTSDGILASEKQTDAEKIKKDLTDFSNALYRYIDRATDEITPLYNFKKDIKDFAEALKGFIQRAYKEKIKAYNTKEEYMSEVITINGKSYVPLEVNNEWVTLKDKEGEPYHVNIDEKENKKKESKKNDKPEEKKKGKPENYYIVWLKNNEPYILDSLSFEEWKKDNKEHISSTDIETITHSDIEKFKKDAVARGLNISEEGGNNYVISEIATLRKEKRKADKPEEQPKQMKLFNAKEVFCEVLAELLAEKLGE